jgi:branched-chain amino acid transport system permease protein
MIENITVNGLISGGIYALLAVGFSLVFGVAKIMNMAHTAFYMITGFLIFIGTRKFGFPIVLSALLAILVTVVLGMACYKLFFDRIKEHATAVILISIALAILFQEVFLIGYGGYYHNVPPFFKGHLVVAGIKTSYQHLLAAAASLAALCAIWFLLSKTNLGNAIRAVAEDREIANVMGINLSRICMITMGISVVLAGVAAALVAPIFMVHPLMWTNPLIVILAAVVLGGLGSVKGAVIAAFILGFAETAIASLIPGGSFLKGAVSLSVMVVVLMVRPEGLFGVVFEEERL